jgi:hypothetical protein
MSVHDGDTHEVVVEFLVSGCLCCLSTNHSPNLAMQQLLLSWLLHPGLPAAQLSRRTGAKQVSMTLVCFTRGA